MVDEDSVPPGTTVLNARVVHTIKFDSEGNPFFKSRLVIQGNSDPEKDRVVNEDPFILWSSVRLLIVLGISLSFKIWSRDAKQAFVQSDLHLGREVYVRLPKEPPLLSLMGMPNKGLLQAIKHLYGLPESPRYWW